MIIYIYNACIGWGGTERYAYNLARGLTNGGLEVRIAVPDDCGVEKEFATFRQRFYDVGVPVELIACGRKSGTIGELLVSWNSFRRIQRILGPDVVIHFNRETPGAASAQIIAARLAGIRALVAMDHLPVLGLSAYSRRGRRLALAASRSLDICITESETNRLLAVRSGLPEPIVIHHGVDTREFRREVVIERSTSCVDSATESVVIGSVGRLVPQKGFPLLLDAFAIAVREACVPARLVIVGGGPEGRSLLEQAHRLGIASQVTLLGHREDIRGIMDEFDIFVLASEFEGLPFALLEAMALSKPVIATDVGGIRDAVIDGLTGILIPSRDRTLLASAMSRLIGDETLRQELGARAREFVVDHFEMREMVRETLGVYEQLLQRPSARSRWERRRSARRCCVNTG